MIRLWQNIEAETKIRLHDGDDEIVDTVIRERQDRCTGFRTYKRLMHYFDSESEELGLSGCSFRKKHGSYSYCFKRPVWGDKSGGARREFFAVLKDGPLDLSNPFHGALPIARALRAELKNGHSKADMDWYFSFGPRVAISTMRRNTRVYSPETGELVAGIYFDSCSACRLDAPNKVVRWRELEVEVNGWHAEYRVAAERLMDVIANALGREAYGTNKYQVALEELGR